MTTMRHESPENVSVPEYVAEELREQHRAVIAHRRDRERRELECWLELRALACEDLVRFLEQLEARRELAQQGIHVPKPPPPYQAPPRPRRAARTGATTTTWVAPAATADAARPLQQAARTAGHADPKRAQRLVRGFASSGITRVY